MSERKDSETSLLKMYNDAPASIALSVLLFIIGAMLNAICQAWFNSVLCLYGAYFVLKGWGSIRWLIIASAGLSIFCPPVEYKPGFIFNTIMCVVHIVLLYTPSARKWFRERGEAYANRRREEQRSSQSCHLPQSGGIDGSGISENDGIDHAGRTCAACAKSVCQSGATNKKTNRVVVIICLICVVVIPSLIELYNVVKINRERQADLIRHNALLHEYKIFQAAFREYEKKFLTNRR